MSKGKNAALTRQLDAAYREPDESLIESVAARDESAMRTLYGRYSARVFRFVARIVKDEHLAAKELAALGTALDRFEVDEGPHPGFRLRCKHDQSGTLELLRCGTASLCAC